MDHAYLELSSDVTDDRMSGSASIATIDRGLVTTRRVEWFDGRLLDDREGCYLIRHDLERLIEAVNAEFDRAVAAAR